MTKNTSSNKNKIEKKTTKKTRKKTNPKQAEYNKMYRKYCLAMGLILGTFLITYLLFLLYNEVMDNKYNNSYLIKNNLVKEVIKINDYQEKNDLRGSFLYITYRGQKEIYELEKELKPLIKNYNLQDKFYYIDLSNTNYINNLEELNNLLKLYDFKIEQLPTIIYINNNNEILRNNIIKREDNNMIMASDFQKLLDINGF